MPIASTRGPQPIDLMQVFLTAEEVFCGRLGLPFAEAELREVARCAMLVRCAKILGAYDRMQADRETLDEGLVAGWFTEPTATKVCERLRRDRRLFAPQALLMLMRLAIVHSPELVPEGRPHRFPALVLAIQDDLGAQRDEAPEPARPNVFTGERGVIKKVGQIDSTIRQLVRDESRLTGHLAIPRRRYMPVLVVTEGFPVNPMSMTAICGRLADQGLLNDPRVGPLHILDQEELNIAEAISESGGPSLLQLLEEHERANLHAMDFRSWLIVERNLTADRPNAAIARVSTGPSESQGLLPKFDVFALPPGPQCLEAKHDGHQSRATREPHKERLSNHHPNHNNRGGNQQDWDSDPFHDGRPASLDRDGYKHACDDNRDCTDDL